MTLFRHRLGNGLLLALVCLTAGLAYNNLSRWHSRQPVRSQPAGQAIATRASLDSGWSYRYGDDTTGAWQPAVKPWGEQPGRDGQDSLWLRTRLPAVYLDDASLLLHRPILDVDVYLDDRLVYSSGGAERGYAVVGTSLHLIPIQGGSELLIRVHSSLPFLGLPDPVIVDSDRGHLRRLLVAELDEGIMLGLFLFIAVGSLLLAGLSHLRRLALGLAACAALSLGYVLSQTNLKDFFLPSALPWLAIWLAALFLLPAAFVNLLTAIQPLRWLQRLRFWLAVAGLVGLAVLALYLVILRTPAAGAVFKLLFVYRLAYQLVILLTGLACIIAALLHYARSGQATGWLLGAGLSAFFGVCVGQIQVAFGSGAAGAAGNIHVGLAAFLLSGLGVLLLKLEGQRRTLALSHQAMDTYKAALQRTIAKPLVIVAANGSTFYSNEAFRRQFGANASLQPGWPALNSAPATAAGPVAEPRTVSLEIAAGRARHRRQAILIPLQDGPSAGQTAVLIHDEGQTDGLSLGANLTAREGELVALTMTGLSNQALAERLSISLRTVKAHLSSIFDKLGIGSRRELMAKLLTSQAVDQASIAQSAISNPILAKPPATAATAATAAAAPGRRLLGKPD